MKPSDEQIGNIWPDTHPVKIAYDLQGDEFLKGEIHEEMNENLRLKDQDLKLKSLT